ncbi:MAG: PP2C family protein-serine/threonine phosphatase [Acidobacteriota bacterium]
MIQLLRRLARCAIACILAASGARSLLVAQTPVAVSHQQCVWRAGDNLAWAAPNLDEKDWKPYTGWRMDGRSPRIWVRCQVNLSPLAGLANPALQFEYGRAFQAFLNGRQIGSNGELSGGWYTSGLAPVFPIHESASGLEHAVIAVRISYRAFEESEPVRIWAGEEEWLKERYDSIALHRSHRFFPVEVCYLAIGFAGFLLFGMYLNDRHRLELLLLAMCCWCQLINRTVEYIDVAAMPTPWALSTALFAAGQCLGLPIVWFIFRLAGKRVPWLFRILIGVGLLHSIQLLLDLALPVNLSLRASAAFYSVYPAQIALESLTALATPLVAFWPWSGIEKRLRGLALCCLLWVSFETVWLAFVIFTSAFSEETTMVQQWANFLLLIRAFATLAVIVALVALLFRNQRRAAEERALLAGEMQAARSVQQVIIPEAIPCVPGFAIQSVYKPAGQIGGDFFQVLPTASGGILAVIGDVSGKGAPAAMTVSLLVGAFRALAHYTQSPAEILRAINQCMAGRNSGGFTTCLVLRVDADGTLTAANAGHIAPYADGKELPLENGLPLGLSAESVYPETTVTLHPTTRLTLLTDGVVEAQDARGELFGFERTAAISSEPAEEIARSAQTFGQEDDITVLTLDYAGAEAAYA